MRNRETKYAIAALVSYSLASVIVWHPIIGDRFYVYEDLRQVVGWLIVTAWLNVSYIRGVRDWGYTILLHLWNYWMLVGLFDAINIAMVYNDTFPSVIKGNAILNEQLIYSNLAICGGIYAVINLMLFCIIAPNVPKWLHRDEGIILR